jgi:hypothetical protein
MLRKIWLLRANNTVGLTDSSQARAAPANNTVGLTDTSQTLAAPGQHTVESIHQLGTLNESK